MNTLLDSENILVYEVSINKDHFSESCVSRKRLLYNFICDYKFRKLRNICIFLNNVKTYSQLPEVC